MALRGLKIRWVPAIMPVLAEHVSSLPPSSAYLTASNADYHVLNLPCQEPRKLVTSLTSDWKRLFKTPTWHRAYLPAKEPWKGPQPPPWEELKTSQNQDGHHRLPRPKAGRLDVSPSRAAVFRQKLGDTIKETAKEKRAYERYLLGLAPANLYLASAPYAHPSRHPAALYPPVSARQPPECYTHDLQDVPQTNSSELRKKVILLSIEEAKRNDCWQKIQEMRLKLGTSGPHVKSLGQKDHHHDKHESSMYSDSPTKYDRLIQYRPPSRLKLPSRFRPTSAHIYGSPPAYLFHDTGICYETRASKLRKMRIQSDQERLEQRRCDRPPLKPGDLRLNPAHQVHVNQTLTSERRKKLAAQMHSKHVCLWRQLRKQSEMPEKSDAEEEKPKEAGCDSGSRFVHFIYDGVHQQYRPYFPAPNKKFHRGQDRKYRLVSRYKSHRSKMGMDEFYNSDSRLGMGVEKTIHLVKNSNYRSERAWIRSQGYERHYKKSDRLERLKQAYLDEERRRQLLIDLENSKATQTEDTQKSGSGDKRRTSIKKVISTKVSKHKRKRKSKDKGRNKGGMWSFQQDDFQYSCVPFTIDNYSYNNMYYFMPPKEPGIFSKDVKTQNCTLKIIANKSKLNSRTRLPNIQHKSGRM